MKNPLKTLSSLDDRLCEAIVAQLNRPLGGACRAAIYPVAAALGFFSAYIIGNTAVVESLLCALVFMLWCAAFFSRTRMRGMDVLLSGATLFALFSARMAALPVISPDCNEYLLPWAQRMEGMSFGEIMRGRVGDYTVLYQYFVFLLSRLPLDRVVLYKLLSISFEPLLAYSATSLVSLARGWEDGSKRAALVFLAVLAVPTVFLNSAVWAQCDVIYAAFALYGVLSILKQRPHIGCAALAVALSLKLQTIFILPVCALMLIWRKLSLRHAVTALGTLVLIALPALLCGKGIKGVIGVYLYQMDEYRDLVLNAPTIFQMIPTSTSTLKLILTNSDAEKAGILLAGAAACAILCLGAQRRKPSATLVIDICFTLCVCIPFLLPHMHDRYFFLADVLSLVYAAVHPRRAYAPVIMISCSLSCYCFYLFESYLAGFSQFFLPMIVLCAATAALLARDVQRASKES